MKKRKPKKTRRPKTGISFQAKNKSHNLTEYDAERESWLKAEDEESEENH